MPDLESAAYLASPAAMGSILTGGTYRRARHLDLLSNALVDLAMGDISRLMVLMPPRHGKSETCSFWFPTWLYSLWPTTRIIAASYGFSLARDQGHRVREALIEHSLGVWLAKGTKAAANWKTTAGGAYFAAGVGGGVTGRGADILLMDDVVSGHAEASSLVIQERNWNWWNNDFRTRLNKDGRGGLGGGILAVGTRWNENDLLGKLLQAFKAGPGAPGYEPWTILCLPAEAEENDPLGRRPARKPCKPELYHTLTPAELEEAIGDPLWPEPVDATGKPLWGREWIAESKARFGTYTWAALYQQRPAPLEGGIIQKEWIKRYSEEDTPDQVDEIATSWDMTFKKTGSSFVVGQAWARVGAKFYLLDQRRGKWDFVETLAAVRSLAAAWPEARAHYIEAAANGEAVMATLMEEIPGIVPVPPEGGKDSRLFAVSPLFEARNVYLPDDPWAEENVYELISFPNAANNDTVDAMSQALTRMSVRQLRQEEITMGAINERATTRPLDSFSYTSDGDVDDDDGPRPPRKRIRFGYDAR